MDVSIIIVNWNTERILKDCLESVYDQTDGIEFEVIVVDNASTDNSVNMVKKDFPTVVLIENTENCGFAAANNQAMRICKGRYLLLLNSDTVVLDRAIEKTVAFADSHPDAGAVGCRTLNDDRTYQPTCAQFPSLPNMILASLYLNKLFPHSRLFAREQMGWWDGSDTREVDVIFGCFMLIRRQTFEQVGCMDETFFMYAEETDWCYRIKSAGWKILYTHQAEIIHLGGASSKLRKPEMVLQLRGSILLFLKKHASRITYLLSCLSVSVFFLLRTPYWLAKSIFSKQRKACFVMAMTYVSGTFKALRGARPLCVKE